MIQIYRANPDSGDFIALVKHLDTYLAVLDGEDHAFYAQFNKTDKLRFVVMAYEEGIPVGCGALRELPEGTMEIKRMYVVPEYRGRRIAVLILEELEKWAAELSFHRCVLETGQKQYEAIRLYEKMGYVLIPNYGQYEGMENSVCFGKEIGSRGSGFRVPGSGF